MVNVLLPYSFQLPNTKPDIFVLEKCSQLLFSLLFKFDFQKLLPLVILVSILATFLTFISLLLLFCETYVYMSRKPDFGVVRVPHIFIFLFVCLFALHFFTLRPVLDAQCRHRLLITSTVLQRFFIKHEVENILLYDFDF